jgi:hypothetical protein
VRGQRSDRSRGKSGPLESEELLGLFNRGYGLSSRRFLAESWGLEPEAEGEEVAGRINDEDAVIGRLKNLSKRERVALSQVAASGGRMRGENLRRDLLLRGFGDQGVTLKSLVESSILIPLPNPGESELDIEGLLEQENFLQRDLAVPVPLIEELSEEAESLGPEALGQWSGDIETTLEGDLDSLELNLVHLSSMLQQEPLRLNKSGTPNRRSLARFARGITMPGGVGEAADELDLKDALQLDYLTFLLAMCVEFGFVELDGQTIVGRYEAVEDYFCADVDKRNRALVNCFQGMKHWNEVESHDLGRGQSRSDAEEHFSYFEPTGEPLIGARGYVLSVLRRSRMGQWTPLSAIIDLCAQLDRSYLPRALGKIEPPIEPRVYIEAVLRRALMWMGLVELGESEDGVEMIRATDRGIDVLGIDAEREEEEGGKSPGECLVVQPNFEVMLFLDPAPLKIVYRLYQIGRRDKLTDRVANFRLTAESVQRGFGLGLDADKVVELLNEYSHAPVPDTVSFQLQDWERVHQKLKLYANGLLVRHNDPDQLDLIIGQLRHSQGNEDFEAIRLGPSSAYIPDADTEGVERVTEQDDTVLIDYLGEIPPSLYFVDSLEVMVDTMESDFVTLSELDKIAEDLEDGYDTTKFFRLDVSKIKQRWPEDTLESVIEFLDQRSDGGLPSMQALRLRNVLDEPLEVAMSRGVTVIVMEDEASADHFASIPECDPIIERRLGEVAFAIKRGQEEVLDEILEELGVRLEE